MDIHAAVQNLRLRLQRINQAIEEFEAIAERTLEAQCDKGRGRPGKAAAQVTDDAGDARQGSLTRGR